MSDCLSYHRLEKINSFRKQLKLEAITPQKRKCMTCFKNFKSEGFHNRLCNSCRPHTDELAAPYIVVTNNG